MTAREFLSQAIAATGRGDWRPAERNAVQCILLSPADAYAHYYLGFARLQREAWADGLSAIARAICCLPARPSGAHLAEFMMCRGFGTSRTGDTGASRAAYAAAAVANPGNVQAYFNLVHVQNGLDSVDAADANLRRALHLKPDFANLWNQLGVARNQPGHLKSAVAALRRAQCLQPDHHLAPGNLAIVQKRLDRVPAAIRAFRRATIVAPDNLDQRHALGLNLLLTGAFDAGWTAFSERRWRSGFSPVPDAPSPLPVWDGRPVLGGSLLVWCEDKVGDEILFASLLPDIARLVGRVTLVCNPRLEDLFRDGLARYPRISIHPTDDNGGAPDAALAEAAACYPLEYLGRFIRRRFSDFPPPTAYLRDAVPPRPTRQREQLRVGLCWWTANNVIGQYRRQPLASWEAILRVPGIEFVSLQYGEGLDELDRVEQQFGMTIDRASGIDQLEDMQGFANLVASLDLVISIPSTTVHVAGAIGTPAWMMTPTGAGLSWFWFQDRRRGLWYPGIELFRQKEVMDWAPVVSEVADRLRGWVAGRN